MQISEGAAWVIGLLIRRGPEFWRANPSVEAAQKMAKFGKVKLLFLRAVIGFVSEVIFTPSRAERN